MPVRQRKEVQEVSRRLKNVRQDRLVGYEDLDFSIGGDCK